MPGLKNKPKSLPRGIPEGHPSIGKHVREAVQGPSWPETRDHGGGRMIKRSHELVFGIALALWTLYSRIFFISPYFKDPDVAKLAFGLAQRMQGIPYGDGVFYQLEKTSGSYYLYEILIRIFSVDIAHIPQFMTYVCASFMVGILILNFSLAKMIWGQRVALISTTLLAISPMMWITGEYPTTLVPALFFFMLAVWAMVISYRVKGGRPWVILSGILFGWSILVRADMVLGMLVPICYAFFVDRRGLRRAFIIYGISAVVFLIGAAFLISKGFTVVDIIAVGPHHPDYPKSLLLNWWGMGPFLFVFAFAGFVYRFITDRKPLPFIFFWIVGFNSFYTGHLYSPSYFISYYPAVAWLAAFSIIAFYGWLVRLVRYNRPMRVVFMAIFACAALTMLTCSTIKECDKPVQFKWADYISYSSDTGLHPTGSAWFYMQDFRKSKGFQYSWLENGASHAAYKLFYPGSEVFQYFNSATYIGSESQIYLNYYLMASGWKFTAVRGDFISFNQPGADSSQGPLTIQTAYQGDKPVPAFGFLANPPTMNLYLGQDVLPHLIDLEGEVGSPTLLTMSGWNRKYSFDGLDIIAPGPLGGQADGSLQCEKELYRFFHTDAIPHQHISLINDEGVQAMSGGEVTGGEFESLIEPKQVLTNVKSFEFIGKTIPGRWLVLAINNDTLIRGYSISIDDMELVEPETLARNLPGYGFSHWDLVLIPPELIRKEKTIFTIVPTVPGTIFDIYFCQRTYPDYQYRNETARKLGLEFQDIICIR